MPELSEAKVNDTLGLYLEIIKQQDKSVTSASHHGAGGEPNRSETADKLSVGSKCPGSWIFRWNIRSYNEAEV
jgi:hypothetical protein